MSQLESQNSSSTMLSTFSFISLLENPDDKYSVRQFKEFRNSEFRETYHPIINMFIGSTR